MSEPVNNPKTSPPRLGLRDTMGFLIKVVAPTFALGVIRRRPLIEHFVERLGVVGRAVTFMDSLRKRYGAVPVLIDLPGRHYAVVLSATDAQAVLHRTPTPFETLTDEKRATIAHFAPDNSLVSPANDRQERRAVSDRALESHSATHSRADRFATVMHDTAGLCEGSVDYLRFASAWARATRRIVLGERAADDHELTDELLRLRRRANWAFFLRADDRRRSRYQASLKQYVEDPETGSLVSMMGAPSDNATAQDQVSQWLFAFDAAGIATWRAMALLSTLTDGANQVRAEHGLSYARGAVLESLRLWPTTPAILRQTHQRTTLAERSIPASTVVLIYVPFLHRSPATPGANVFEPKRWLEPSDPPAFLAFSAGPAECPAHNLVPLLGAQFIASALEDSNWTLVASRKKAMARGLLPGELDFSRIRFELSDLRP